MTDAARRRVGFIMAVLIGGLVGGALQIVASWTFKILVRACR